MNRKLATILFFVFCISTLTTSQSNAGLWKWLSVDQNPYKALLEEQPQLQDWNYELELSVDDFLDDLNLIQSAPNKLPAVIFDLDNTVIFSPSMLKKLKRNTSDTIRIDPIFDIYEWAVRNKCAIIFISSRIDTPQNRQLTTQQLLKAEYYKIDTLIMRPSNCLLPTHKWKESERIKLPEQLEILATIDDIPPNLTGARIGLIQFLVP